MNNKKEEKFITFINTLTQQTMIALGIIPWPDNGKLIEKLDVAKEIINIIEILKEKTQNNLSYKEEQLLNNSLCELKIHFINKQKNK